MWQLKNTCIGAVSVLLLGESRTRLSRLGSYLVSQGHSVHQEILPTDTLGLILAINPCIIIVDNASSPCGGPELCEQIRTLCHHGYILLFDDQAGLEIEGISALLKGADDFVFSPLATGVLAAKLFAVSRRLQTTVGTARVLRGGSAALHLIDRTFSVDGQQVELTRREFALLRLLMEAQGATILRERVYAALSIAPSVGKAAGLDTFVARLRAKLRKGLAGYHPIHTVRGVGFQFVPPLESSRTVCKTAPGCANRR